MHTLANCPGKDPYAMSLQGSECHCYIPGESPGANQESEWEHPEMVYLPQKQLSMATVQQSLENICYKQHMKTQSIDILVQLPEV